jgi:hypothetical protein
MYYSLSVRYPVVLKRRQTHFLTLTQLVILVNKFLWFKINSHMIRLSYRGADKFLARPTSRCILFNGEKISFDASLVLYIYIYIYIVLIFLQL